jgi:hypothetical protein
MSDPVDAARRLGGDDVAAEVAAQHQRLEALRSAFSGSVPPARRTQTHSSLDRNPRGELLLWPQNRAAALVWLQTGDQWHRAGLDGTPVAHDAGVALSYAQELARLDPSVNPWHTTMGVKFIAACVLRLSHEARG